MAGFETVVRPFVSPNIRPAPAQPVPPADDSTKGFATIHGNGAKTIQMSSSYSTSASTNTHSEIERRADEARVYQMDDNGTINKDNFLDVQVASRLKMKGPPGFERNAADELADPVSVARTSLSNAQRDLEYYNRLQAAPNVEIRRRNVIFPIPVPGSGGDGGGETP